MTRFSTTPLIAAGLVLLGTLCSAGSASAQAWAEAFGGSDLEVFEAVEPTSDGGFLVAGSTRSYGSGGDDAWVLKLSALGVVEWQRSYGGTGNERVQAIRETTDGGSIFVAYTGSFGAGNNDFWVVKLDSSGTIVWQWAYGGNSDEVPYDIRQTTDGGYVVLGRTSSFGAGSHDVWLVKLGPAGSIEWQVAYGDTGDDRGAAIYQTSDSGYVFTGETGSFGAGGYDVWVVKVDALGVIETQWAYGGTGTDIGRSIQQTADGGYIVGGFTNSSGAGSYDMWMLRLDSVGTIVWDSVHGGVLDDQIHSIDQTSDGGFVGAGFRDGVDVSVVKYDASGVIQWQNSFDGTDTEYAWEIQQTSDGGFAVAGQTQSFGAGNWDGWVLRLDAAGTLGGSCPGVSQNTESVSSDTPGAATFQCSN